jgi:hypothetical protein
MRNCNLPGSQKDATCNMRYAFALSNMYHSVYPLVRLGPSTPSPASECFPLRNQGGDTLACGWGGPNADAFRKSLVLCLLFEVTNTFYLTVLYYRSSSLCIFWHKQLQDKSVLTDILTNIKNYLPLPPEVFLDLRAKGCSYQVKNIWIYGQNH